jgi:hypothetical protein
VQGGVKLLAQQEGVEALGGFVPVEGLAGAAVELLGDGVEIGLGVRGEVVGVFGEVLA